jgi:hypothetical protein
MQNLFVIRINFNPDPDHKVIEFGSNVDPVNIRVFEDKFFQIFKISIKSQIHQ